MFTVVLFTDVSTDAEGNRVYTFVTQSDGTTTAKSPEDMFDFKVPNDIRSVIEQVDQYYN